MKELQFPDFPRDEYVERLARTQQMLQERQIDALFLTQRANLRYFAGLRDGTWDAYHFYYFVIMPAQGEPVMLVANGFQNLMKQCWIEDIRYWSWTPEFYAAKETNSVKLVLDVLREKRLHDGVIGMELGPDMHMHIGRAHVDELITGLPQARIVDASDTVWSVRSVKSEREIARIREAARISMKGVKAGFEALRPGMTEKDVMRVVTSVMGAEGASELRFNALYAGRRAMWADGMPTDNVIQPGDLVQFDGGCVYEGYWCDFKRMAAVGEPRPDQRRFYDLAKEGLFAALGVMKAGVSFDAPLRAAFEVNNHAGFSDFTDWCLASGWAAIGHCLGLDVHESPALSATNTALLQENMVLSVEPYITLGGFTPFWDAPEKFGLEDVVRVTQDGVEVFTDEESFTHELWVV